MENGQLIEWLTYCIYLKIWLSTAMWVYQRVALREHQASTTCSCVVEPLLIVLASKEIDKALLLELRIVHMHRRGYSFFSISQLILMARIFSKVHGWSINNINMIMSYYANCHNDVTSWIMPPTADLWDLHLIFPVFSTACAVQNAED